MRPAHPGAAAVSIEGVTLREVTIIVRYNLAGQRIDLGNDGRPDFQWEVTFPVDDENDPRLLALLKYLHDKQLEMAPHLADTPLAGFDSMG